ncbi:MAG: hypothetical protein IPM56_03235 [Ignavibacteriales bacterium]|nr:MAG: hypothetical protein IPM56_03235 [Ignavibacteriales bacterium]
MKKKILLYRFFALLLVSILSIGFGFFRILNNPNIVGKELFLVIFSLIVIPIVSQITNLFFIIFRFDKIVESFNEVKKEIDISLDKLKTQFPQIIFPQIYLTRLEVNSKSLVLFSFSKLLHKKYETDLNDLSQGHIYEYIPFKYHEFVKNIFSHCNTKILATSIVNPKSFWQQPKSEDYLQYNQGLIKSGKEIRRYFFLISGKENEYKDILATNLTIGVKVFLICENDIPDEFKEKLIQDVGLIDDEIAITSEVNMKTRTITKVEGWMGQDQIEKINEVKEIFTSLNTIKKTIFEVYNCSEEEMKATAKTFWKN